MYCRYCGKKLPQVSDTCASCGRENAFKDLSKRAKIWRKVNKITALVLAVAAVLTLMAGGVYHTISYIKWTQRPNDIFYLSDYTVSSKAMSGKADTVVATCGDHTLTNAQLQVFYWMRVYAFVNNNSSYLTQYGLNPSAPLADQVYNTETGQNWHQFFLEDAIFIWQKYIAVSQLAAAENYKLPAEDQEVLDNLETSVMEKAAQAGIMSVDYFLQSELGAGVTLDDYKYYLNLHYLATAYSVEMEEKETAALTAEEVEAWFTANEDMLKSSYSITKESGNRASVRHILIKPETSGKNENDVEISTDEDWANCEAEAQRILDMYLAGAKTDAAFGELAKEYTEDTESAKKAGGLIENITKSSSFVAPFLNWCMDESRQAGDTGLVKSVYGYHVMYYVLGEPLWYLYSEQGAAKAKCSTLVETKMAFNASSVDFTKLAISDFVPQ